MQTTVALQGINYETIQSHQRTRPLPGQVFRIFEKNGKDIKGVKGNFVFSFRSVASRL